MYFNTFPTTIITKGISHSLVFNLVESNFIKLPNDLLEVVDDLSVLAIEDVYSKYDDVEITNSIKNFITMLVNNKMGICLPERLPFANLEVVENSAIITNAIIEIDYCKQDSLTNLKKSLLQLQSLSCDAVEIRILNEVDYASITDLLEFIKAFDYKAIELTFFKINSEILIEHIENIANVYLFLKKITVFNFKISTIIHLERLKCLLFFSTKNEELKKNCGFITENNFVVNRKLFDERNHNTCLSKKVTIDVNGEIKNCPSMNVSFGNLKDLTIKDALNKAEFKKYWNISKDQILVCTTCEYRNVCTDCRAFVETPDDIYSKPLKCGYDPIANKWEDWSTNPLKEKAIEFYKTQQL